MNKDKAPERCHVQWEENYKYATHCNPEVKRPSKNGWVEYVRVSVMDEKIKEFEDKLEQERKNTAIKHGQVTEKIKNLLCGIVSVFPEKEEKENLYISVAKNFTETPGGRYRHKDEFSGEGFRKDLLEPLFEQALTENKKLVVDLDGTFGYAVCWLEEVFHGLTNKYGKKVVFDTIEIVSYEEPYLKESIDKYILGKSEKI